jgi:copper oxidase (laccase) domain-containing protein
MQRVLTDVDGIVAAQTDRGKQTSDEVLGENYITTLLGDINLVEFEAERDRVASRRRQLCEELNLEKLVIPREYQTHSILLVDRQLDTEPDRKLYPPFTADAMWTMTPGIGLAVSIADCAGILIADTTQQLVAAIHSGHGQSMRALPYRTIKQLPANPNNLAVYISPLADVASYEVGVGFRDEFVDYFNRYFSSLGLKPGDYFSERELSIWPSREHVGHVTKTGIGFDNRQFILDQLRAVGILEANITINNKNTMNPENNLHSYRLDGYKRDDEATIIGRRSSGAQLSVIGIKTDG